MTNQEIFDVVVRHLRKQNAKSRNDVMCLYRGLCGMKCAVGCLIPDELYEKDLEGSSVQDILDFLPGIEEAQIEFLERLQVIHDRQPVELWESSFVGFADKHKLIKP